MQIKRVVKRLTIFFRRLSLLFRRLSYKKVFVIGFNKSATTSFHALFESLGFRSYHGTKWRKLENIEILRKYDCFSDGTPEDLAELDRLFPNSKYILNVRDLKSWIFSRLAHIERAKKSNPDFITYPSWDNTEEAIKHWIKHRNTYHLYVFSFFSERPGDILVVNFIKDELAATKVCKFLGFEGDYQRPKKNTNPCKERPQEHVAMLQNCISELGIPEHELDYDIYCPSLVSEGLRPQYQPDSSMLKQSENDGHDNV